ncbi:PREDICTED: endogenous retrovirus group PABLB member 1 Env polyprotein-like [Cyprinodon variegatus]|uniref:Endogenous retrovirus group PABLB member 1 Env polyprotein-like n=1 Tax=Cyprinodon variegatus TaxID=28743 RepID=A0A3Q2CAB1_CYPVA|nr:PREDICTED: endogenous retrovirus group PABLB member 1 Env polyprotein-like [Cyprinodon variegatus]
MKIFNIRGRNFTSVTKMSFFSELQILILVVCTSGAPQHIKIPEIKRDDSNVFLTMAWEVASHLRPNSSCYVCGLMPYTAGEGLPLMVLPASDCDMCRLMHINLPGSSSDLNCPGLKMRPLHCENVKGNCNRCSVTPKAVPILVLPRRFTWCLENDGHIPMGYSQCLRTFKWGPGRRETDWKAFNSAPHPCLDAAGEARLNALAQRTATCSISSPVGMYWVCGSLAYPYLPVDYKGRCGLGYVVPAMRVTRSLPKRTFFKRVRRGISDFLGTHHQSPFKNALGPLLPFYGVMSALDQIADLSHSIEVIANETGKALTLMSNELASVRLLALQNRAALDFLLAAQGGTCAVIGSECCTFVPDYNITIHEIVSHLHETAKSVHQDGSSVFDFLKNAFGSVSNHVIQMLIVVVVFIVTLSLFVSCMKRFMFG